MLNDPFTGVVFYYALLFLYITKDKSTITRRSSILHFLKQTKKEIRYVLLYT